jgi:hypothetical protein
MGEFAKRAEEVLNDWEPRLAAQEEILHQVIPSSETEAAIKAVKNILEAKQLAYNTGHSLRAILQDQNLNEALESKPKLRSQREISINFPQYKQAGLLDIITNPISHAGEDMYLDLKRKADEKLTRGRTPTTDPSTLPWYLPAITLSAPQSFAKGYHAADLEEDTKMHEALDAQLEEAKKQFDTALATEYHESNIRKSSSAGELIDELAQDHVKSAEGEINQALGGYLSLASLLGLGSYNLTKKWTETNDPRVQRFKALQEIIGQRMRSSPLPVLVGHEAPPPEDEGIEVTE